MSQIKLYMIATPLGNLEDITLRALETFKRVDTFFAEDSRELLKLFQVLKLDATGKKIFSYASHNMKEATEKALEILAEGRDVGFVSDRGTPAISDPGAMLVSRAREAGVQIVPVPGPSSVTTLLSVSGLVETQFLFVGFLPNTQKSREEIFEKIKKFSVATCFFESPKRIRETVLELKEKFPSGSLFIGREMTKIYESFSWFDLKDLGPESLPELGEYALILKPGESQSASDLENEVVLRASSDKEWSKNIAQRLGISASDAYNALQRRKHRTDK